MSDGTLQILDVTMLDDVNNASGLVQLDSNAKIPVCSGAALTNLPGVTKNSSDPVITTNPSGGVGTIWVNTTSGETYCCTDATAGANVWTNVGEGSGNVAPWAYPGENYGYQAGGGPDVIDKHSFTSDGNATDVGNLTSGMANIGPVGQSSPTHGYACGGGSTRIEKYSFSTDGNATDVGDMLTALDGVGGQNSITHGYISGGYPNTNVIQKFPFASDTNTVDWANLTVARSQPGACSLATYGYTVGGSTNYDVIDKFPFASQTDASDVGNLLSYINGGGSNSSSLTYGYSHGGYPLNNVLQKFSFTTDGNATDVADMVHDPAANIASQAGTSSTTYGYASGGGPYIPGGGVVNSISKYSHTTDANSTDVGNLTVARRNHMGTHY